MSRVVRTWNNVAENSKNAMPTLKVVYPPESSPEPSPAQQIAGAIASEGIASEGIASEGIASEGIASEGMKPVELNNAPVRGESSSDTQGLTWSSELQRELDSISAVLEPAAPEEILRWAATRFGENFTMATAFGPEGMVLIHMLAEVAPRTPIFNLDTGYQFPETLELRERIRQRYGIDVELKRPATTVSEYEALHGGPLYKTNPNQCCADRKLAVLKQAVVGKHAWASAIRRDQTSDRAQSPIVGWDKKFSLVKVSPLANWSKKDVWKKIVDHDIPYNALHDRGFPSIGCWPCTRAVQLGEDERAGRWSGFAKTECGLHSVDDK